jgi:hypothetical protein
VRLLKLVSHLSLLLFGLVSVASAQSLDVDVSKTRSIDDVFAKSDAAVKQLNQNVALLTKNQRATLTRAGRYFPNQPISFPSTVWLTVNGNRLPPTRSQNRSVGLTLVFDASGPNAFDATYKQYLQDVFAQAEPFLNALFGNPAVSGNVAVKNYDATMGDREVVSGGYYVPNSPGTPEIRFPFYGNDHKEVTAINFIHTLLLAYMGPSPYGFDAFREGTVRAVTMRLARTGGALPAGLDSDLIEQVLTNTYDVEGLYDWYNRRALGGSTFIAPNLRSVPLPDAGSVGGLYLLRYKMSGGAWTKLLVEHPGFISAFNTAFYGQPGNASNVPALVALGQSTLNSLRPGDPTIEGLSFAEWFRRQFILETKDTRGQKLLVEPVPVTSGLSGTDFGVFIVQANWFETSAGGNETLLSGTSYPILWEGNLTFNRVNPNVQDEKMDIAGGYGVVVPNIKDINGGQPYRATIDVPVQDQIERVYVPVGCIATPSQPNPRDLYGTVTGANLQTGDTLRLKVVVDGVPVSDVPVVNNAFGVSIGTQDYLNNSVVVIDVVRTRNAADTTLLHRVVDKGPGALAVDLRVDSELAYPFPNGLPKGISMIGFPVDPFISLNSDVLGISDNQTLAARYNSGRAKYELYPDLEPFKIGHGYFVRMETAQPSFTVTGRIRRNVEATVALKPGWNMITTPLLEDVSTSNVRVIKTSDFPASWSESLGVDVGTDFFEFNPGTPDAASGAPETGTLTPASTFQQGKAYFVRVLAPEGITLSFAPSGGTGFGPSRAPSAAPTTGWRMKVSMAQGAQKSYAVIGQSPTATKAFDPREDSGMPPGIGGFQAIVEDYEPLFRDVRSVGFQSYTVHLQGLTPGKVVKVDFQYLFGKVPTTFQLRDGNGKSLGSGRPGFTLSLVPKSKDMYLKVEIGGSK